tara:strand:- start:304 stop:744 length:441 start_codon:yes stop_codon:yes gene_type:complete
MEDLNESKITIGDSCVDRYEYDDLDEYDIDKKYIMENLYKVPAFELSFQQVQEIMNHILNINPFITPEKVQEGIAYGWYYINAEKIVKYTITPYNARDWVRVHRSKKGDKTYNAMKIGGAYTCEIVAKRDNELLKAQNEPDTDIPF